MTNYYGLDAAYFAEHFTHPPDWVDPASIPGCDPASFRILNHAWAVDDDRVYLHGRRVSQADRASFRVLNELYARDDRRLYCLGGRVDAIADAASFATLDTGSIEPRLHRYAGYARDHGQVYFASQSKAPRVVAGADAASFESQAGGYARDAQGVYFLGKRIRGAKPAGLRVLGSRYAITHDKVFYGQTPVPQADPRSFRLIDDYLARDDVRLYRNKILIEGADPATWREIEGTNLARDARTLFVSEVAQPGVDMASFEHLGHDYYADRHHVYWRDRIIARADRASFRVINRQGAMDRRREYFEDGSRTAYDAWQAEGRRKQGGGFWKELRFWIELLAALMAGLAAWPFRKLFGKAHVEGPSASEKGATRATREMRLLAKTLAAGNEAALAPVLLALDDLPAFIARYAQAERVADEPDFEALFASRSEDDWDSMHAIDVLVEVYDHHQLVGGTGRKWMAESIEAQVEPMLCRLGVTDFDWSFIEKLEQMEVLQELTHHDFLALLRDLIAPRGLTLVHLSLHGGEEMHFAVLPDAEFAKIDGFADGDHFDVSREWLVEAAYEGAREALGLAG